MDELTQESVEDSANGFNLILDCRLIWRSPMSSKLTDMDRANALEVFSLYRGAV